MIWSGFVVQPRPTEISYMRLFKEIWFSQTRTSNPMGRMSRASVTAEKSLFAAVEILAVWEASNSRGWAATRYKSQRRTLGRAVRASFLSSAEGDVRYGELRQIVCRYYDSMTQSFPLQQKKIDWPKAGFRNFDVWKCGFPTCSAMIPPIGHNMQRLICLKLAAGVDACFSVDKICKFEWDRT